jgi:catechol 2,3-dioxygenase-like lactoylglutathione lyase family enzyme
VVLGIGIVQINVTDLNRAWQFYVETLGLNGKQIFGRGKAFQLEPDRNGPIILVYPVAKMSQRDYPNETGLTLVFYVDDLQLTVAEWRQKGVSFIPISWARDKSGIAESPFGLFIAFQDPFGNVHELLQPSRK